METQTGERQALIRQLAEELWRNIVDLITGTDISLEELIQALDIVRRRALRLKADQAG